MMVVKELEKLLKKYRINVKNALRHLKYSYKKVKKMSVNVHKLSEEQLETWESFIARFSRMSDIFISKYLRTHIQIKDPNFEGSVQDLLNQAEKFGLIKSAKVWLEIRLARNKASHDYDDEKLEESFREIRKLTPIVLNVEKKLS